MRSESVSERLGGRALLNELSAAMFALALRLASDDKQAPTGLLALAGHPRLAPALAAMFQDPARAWTLPDLANLCNMSRATIARQFQENLGRSASELLMGIRMTKAANALKNTTASTGTIGEAAGYQSEAAFQRAFKQRMGVTPARWRKDRTGMKSTVADQNELPDSPQLKVRGVPGLRPLPPTRIKRPASEMTLPGTHSRSRAATRHEPQSRAGNPN